VKPPADAGERQLEAYNAHDADALGACSAEGVIVEDAVGEVLLRGRADLRESAAGVFTANPGLRSEVLTRIRVGTT
jgi:hypothetical protein